LFKVDILNAMGFALALISLLAIVPGVRRVWLAAALGALIAFGAPFVSLMDWSWLPGGVRAYVVPDLLSFGFFPWAAFVAFGVSAGSILRTVGKDRFDVVMQGAAGLGLLLILGARYCSHLPYSLYPKSEYWLNGPWLVLVKLGVVILVLAGAYVWTQYGAAGRWSWVRQLGVTSLLVYWVHTELVYGRWLWFWKERLSPLQTALLSVAVILSMLALSVVKTNLKSLRLRFASSPHPAIDEPFVIRRKERQLPLLVSSQEHIKELQRHGQPAVMMRVDENDVPQSQRSRRGRRRACAG